MQRELAVGDLWIAPAGPDRVEVCHDSGPPAILDPGGDKFARLVRHCGRVFVYSQREAEALRARVPPSLWRTLSQRLADVSLGLLLVNPSLPSFSPETAAQHFGLSDAAGAAWLRTLTSALRKAFDSLGRDIAVILATLLGGDVLLDWLPWPAEAISFAELPVLLARAVSAKRRELSRSDAEGPDDLLQAVEAAFGHNGALSEAHPRFEYRQAQERMARAVASALLREEILVAEAGTGTGKSLAYLIPAALWAAAGHRPIVVATFTRNLQDQLMRRELPTVGRVLGRDVAAVAVKGRANYPCLRLVLATAMQAGQALLAEDRRVAAFLISWLVQSRIPDIEALSPEASQLLPGLSQALENVRAHHWRCLRGTGLCPFEGLCVLRTLRIAAGRADIIITNHAVVAADAAHDLLPDYDTIVIDEAHHLEDAITSALTVELSDASFRRLAEVLGATGRAAGVRAALDALLEDPSLASEWSGAAATWSQWLEQWEQLAGQLPADISELAATAQALPGEPVTLRFSSALDGLDQWEAVRANLQALADLALAGCEALREWAEDLAEQETPGPRSAADMAAAAAALDDFAASVRWLVEDTPGYVRWLEQGGEASDGWALIAAPVRVDDALAEMVYDRCRCVVMTGATLSIEGRMDFFRARCGLERHAHRLVEVVLPSPFQWDKQLLICVPKDIPQPRSDEHAVAVVECIERLARLSGGGLLALFTSRRRMRAAYEELRDSLDANGLTVLCQDISGERWWLLDRMRADEATVVLGVRSFWEGVDVPGHHLRCLVVEKLPFAVPDDPLVAARAEEIDAAGGNGFRDYYLPEAIRALQQGIGRLIRTSHDRGVAFILDPRILGRSYGRRFMASLPPARLKFGSLCECLREAADWLASRPTPE